MDTEVPQSPCKLDAKILLISKRESYLIYMYKAHIKVLILKSERRKGKKK